MAKELAGEILRLAKLGDRPTRVELVIWGFVGISWGETCRITSPIENGTVVFHVFMCRAEQNMAVKYDTQNRRGVASLIAGMLTRDNDGHDDDIQLFLLKDGERSEVPIASWKFPSVDPLDGHHIDYLRKATALRFEEVQSALQAMVTM